MKRLEDLDIIEDSLCKDCAFRIHRQIVLLHPEDVFDESSEVDLDEIGEDETLVVEQVFCAFLQIDLDHIVLSCNKYLKEGTDNGGIFKTDIYR